MHYKFEFRPYQRKFVRTVVTSHGIWEIREGIILRLTDEFGKVGWGEIAPISWFGCETLEQALNFCQQLSPEITEETIFSIPDDLPACQFGFESAISPPPPPVSLSYSGLLPAGEAALEAWQELWQQGYSTFKWKIAVYPKAVELKILASLLQSLPVSTKLRLDANCGLSFEEANLWLATCDKVNADSELPVKIEFIEQPLPVDEFPAMLELSRRYQSAIALDESIATLKQLEYYYKNGWRGIFVIKPGIVGSPSRLRQFCQQHKIDAVFSSVFETIVGRKAALQLAVELSQHNRAVGFGVSHYFGEEDAVWLENLW
ncbi:o-succinylbenzoate synthase [Chlorogloeopsis sp. ULAP01]|uniref:o-succinylbenzoate synthase n=1 Tax=Chlorogloeopsis sp. ULAP01 TaxID=3056483 RepID=UPI0025AAB303|nr:o-succinylbenzoate synthase [Chlorogloeopsis sp. ULAP01]MDM9380506.1 o-succinylbenzoate synthase [Chlorogloeopsis sp. ULAP01]